MMNILVHSAHSRALVQRGLALATVLLMTGCGQAPLDPLSHGKCQAASASPDQLFEMGRGAEGLPSVSCKEEGLLVGLRWKWTATESERALAGGTLKEHAASRPAYQEGEYAQLLPESSPPAARKAFGELGVALEDIARTRQAALTCRVAEESEIAVVGTLDTFFATAVVGLRVPAESAQAVQTLAGVLLTTAATRATTRGEDPVCDEQLTEKFRQHVRQWVEFAEGRHPWAPYCRVSEEGADFILRCDPR